MCKYVYVCCGSLFHLLLPHRDIIKNKQDSMFLKRLREKRSYMQHSQLIMISSSLSAFCEKAQISVIEFAPAILCPELIIFHKGSVNSEKAPQLVICCLSSSRLSLLGLVTGLWQASNG